MESIHIDVNRICREFGFKSDPVKVESISFGHINATIHVWFEHQDYILQRINTGIFKRSEEMMSNISLILDAVPALSVCRANDGKPFFKDETGFYRMMNFVKNSKCYQQMSSPELAYKLGAAMKLFHIKMKAIDASKLYETLPNFHNMIWRYEQFEEAIKFNYQGRLSTCQKEVDFLMKNKERGSVISKLYNSGKLRKCVTHNDTKLNNVLFDKDTDEYITFIDLDTVMPGTILFDVGDMIRTGCSTAAEDEKDLSKCKFSMDFYNALTSGYLDNNDDITELERSLISESGRTLTQIMAVRFLTDYLNGDTYYHIEYPDHNLVRTRTQIKQIEEMDKVFSQPEINI